MNWIVSALIFGLAVVKSTDAEDVCLVKYDTNDTSVRLDLRGIEPEMLRGEPGIPGKRGPAGPPGPIGGSENDTVLRQRYDEKIAALEARLNALGDPTWLLATNGFRYKVFAQKVTYDEAKKLCRDNGARLATIGMRQPPVKAQVISALIRRTGAWVGLDDLAQRRRWTWVDGEPSNHQNTDWDLEHDEPNNSGGNERCAHIRIDISPGKLNDFRCERGLFALCEKTF